MVAGKMIDLKLLDHFYSYENSAAIEPLISSIANDVKEAYFVFINDFCTTISSTWKKYLKNYCNSKDTATFAKNLTKSDEAYCYWLMTCLYDKCIGEAEFIKKNSLVKWKQERKKGKAGKHDSVKKFDEYVSIYNKVSTLRGNEDAYKCWQTLFFDKFFVSSDEKSVNKLSNEKVLEKRTMVEIPADFD
jgi:hypothetical protein